VNQPGEEGQGTTAMAISYDKYLLHRSSVESLVKLRRQRIGPKSTEFAKMLAVLNMFFHREGRIQIDGTRRAMI
jgi:hypothetical protein